MRDRKSRKPNAAQNVHTISQKKELWNIYVFAMSHLLSPRIATRESDRIYIDWKLTSGCESLGLKMATEKGYGNG